MNPHKSTTHEEQFFHVNQRATVFFRKEGEWWCYSMSLCNPKDQFVKKIGRSLSRRKYFQGYRNVVHGKPSYALAEALVYDVITDLFTR